VGDGGSVADKDLLSFFLVINGGKQARQHAAAKWEEKTVKNVEIMRLINL
jgi:hypothetical protein